MKSCVILALFCAIFAYKCEGKRLMFRGLWYNLQTEDVGQIEAGNDSYVKWFDQKLDHFDPTNEKTWKQRYFVNDEFYEGSDTAFLQIGGEGAASAKWMTNGAWITYAKKYKPLLFQLEHRYYGQSHPTEDMSVENLKYLTSEQALADLANFIVSMNGEYNFTENVKWIAFGGSYPGNLAAWLRQKYPHLVRGSMSASGPLLAHIDFKEYFWVVTEALRTYSDECVDSVKSGIEQVETLLKTELGQKNLDEQFKLCDPIEDSIDNPKDVSSLFANIADNFAGVVQYNKDNRIGDSLSKNITIDVVCEIMTNQELGTPLTRLASVSNLLVSANNESCFDYKYDKQIETLQNVSWASEASQGGRQWTYQTCTEFGYYQSSSSEPHIFGEHFPVDFFVQQCADIYGAEFDEELLKDGVKRTNTIYGGLDIQVSNVVFVHGSIDPWHVLGITNSTNKKAPSIFINGTAHCANMYPESDEDLQELKDARTEIEDLIGIWLQ